MSEVKSVMSCECGGTLHHSANPQRLQKFKIDENGHMFDVEAVRIPDELPAILLTCDKCGREVNLVFGGYGNCDSNVVSKHPSADIPAQGGYVVNGVKFTQPSS